MSRITRVRSTTRISSVSSRRRCWFGVRSSSHTSDLGVHLATQRTQLLDLARADVGPRVGRGAVLHDLADDLDADGVEQLVHLGELAGIGTRT